MPKRIEVDGVQSEISKIDNVQFKAIDIRVGKFFSKLKDYQKKRFNRIVDSLARKLNLNQNRSPMEMILIRQVALDTVRIEDTESDIDDGLHDRYSSDAAKWLLLAKRERRDTLNLLSIMSKKTEKVDGVAGFGNLRDAIRNEEGLEKSPNKGVALDGHQRRIHKDGITRTTK